MVSPRTVTPATTPWMVLCWPDDWSPLFDLSLSDCAKALGATIRPRLNTTIAARFMIPLLPGQGPFTDVVPTKEITRPILPGKDPHMVTLQSDHVRMIA